MYGKHFESMYTGSMFGAGMNVFAVWGFAIANKGSDGVVEINPPFVASALGCGVEDVTSAIEFLCSPDENSRSEDKDGRRLLKVGSFTYEVVNHAKYVGMKNAEDRRRQGRESQARFREKHGGTVVSSSKQIVINSKQPVINSKQPVINSKQPVINSKQSKPIKIEDEDKDILKPLSSKLDGTVKDLFSFWQKTLKHPKAILSADRLKKIKARLKEGYPPERIKSAILGIANSPHNMGINEHGKKYDDIELICRTGSNVDRFADMETTEAVDDWWQTDEGGKPIFGIDGQLMPREDDRP